MTNLEFSYSDIEKSYKEDLYFDVINIDIKVKVRNPDESNNTLYKIKGVSSNTKCNNEELAKKVGSITEEINVRLIDDSQKFNNNWSLFYLYKELLQQLDGEYKFSRGQCTDWEMLPGIIRKNTNDELKNKFEITYKDIMYRYPDLVQYYPAISDESNIKMREQELAHLQHYGMKTSLIDITENPYIALLFMVSDTSANDFEFATLDLYNIDPEIHDKFNLFSKVKQLNTNQRIIAQKGAFLNFDKVSLTTPTPSKINKIPLIRIKLKISFKHLKKTKRLLEKEKSRHNELKEEYLTMMDRSNEQNDNNEEIRKEDIQGKIREYFELGRSVNALKRSVKSQKEYYEKIVLSRIRMDIKNKLAEYHYREKHLYPDLYKHIQYVESEYVEKRMKENTKAETRENVNAKNLIANFLI
ncbi:FRG domain-containing protein [Mammaliicoccus sp. A-M4]|uniref:FRG domain-containing protein n=1 Tax=Mammaliicoccus sp. A-M4 TaxID=2898664 RepID=UPI001EFC2CF6|nr:FRG domain-containing protein [Mammaliicoccus sp. A-M4]